MDKFTYMGRTVDLKNQKVWDFLKKGKNLKGIFQLETHSASKVLQTIAPNNIEELAICNSANRPGAMSFVEEIADVKHGRKEARYLHPSLKKYFEPTFSRWVYQEQILQIAKELAGFSASESSNLMKSLGKKDSDKMQKLKDSFVEGMVKNEYSKEVAEELFKEMKEFANYGFNKCLSGDTILKDIETGEEHALIDLYNNPKSIKLYSIDENGNKVVNDLIEVFPTGEKEIFEVTFSNGQKIKCTMNHKFLCDDFYFYTLDDIVNCQYRICEFDSFDFVLVSEVKKIGIRPTFNLTMKGPNHNYVIGSVCNMNSHAVGYSLLGFFNAEVKIENTLEFFTSLFNNLKPTDPLGELFEVSTELPDFNLKLLSPSIDKISDKFEIEDGNIRYPLGLIKGLGSELYKKLSTLNSSQLATIDSCLEALINVELNSKAIESIIICGALDKFAIPREEVLLHYWFLSSLQSEVLEKFWLFKNGHALSKELILKFLEFREEKLVGKSKKLKWASYFKTEATREKTLNGFKEDIKLVESYKENIKAAYYIWEMSILGYSNNYKFSDKLKTYAELDTLDLDDKAQSFGFVEDVMHRKSQRGNGYGIYTLKFDRRQTFMFFGDNYSFAKDFIQKGDFVAITAKKELKGLQISTIKSINNEVRKYEFWRKATPKEQV